MFSNDHALPTPNGVFQITGPTLPYDSFTGDMVHRLFPHVAAVRRAERHAK